MFDFNPLPGAEKKWYDPEGRLLCVLRAFKKRKKRGRKTDTHTVIRILTPKEYDDNKLTGSGK